MEVVVQQAEVVAQAKVKPEVGNKGQVKAAASSSVKVKQGKKGGCPEALQRMDFLLRASAHAATSSPASAVLSSHLGSHLAAVGRKAVLRLAPEVKRTRCRGCGIALSQGRTGVSTISGRGKGKRSCWRCLWCGTTREIPLKVKKKHLRSTKKKDEKKK